jgi:hypothetical protein
LRAAHGTRVNEFAYKSGDEEKFLGETHIMEIALAHTYLLLFTLIAHIRTNESAKRRVCRVRAPYANS